MVGLVIYLVSCGGWKYVYELAESLIDYDRELDLFECDTYSSSSMNRQSIRSILVPCNPLISHQADNCARS